MSVDRARIRSLVRRELERRIGSGSPRAAAASGRIAVHAALVEIESGPGSLEGNDDPALGGRPACVIEPGRPCVDSGYCKKLGF